jgi:hypothetical protein
VRQIVDQRLKRAALSTQLVRLLQGNPGALSPLGRLVDQASDGNDLGDTQVGYSVLGRLRQRGHRPAESAAGQGRTQDAHQGGYHEPRS